ncbi:IS1634-like element ISMsm6 family transposase [Okibacterium endophyticum]
MGLFVRKVKTASGATAVQIASKTRGVRTIVEHLGSAHDDAQLAVLVAVARDRIAELRGQGEFDLDVLLPTPAATAAPMVAGSRSRVLWEVLEDAYAALGFDAIDDETFKQLVLARVVEPTSKADTLRVWAELGVPDAPSLSTIWRTLSRSITHDWRGRAAAVAYAHATRVGALTLVLYDVTTLYFEAEHEDRIRKVGMSKERRVDPQILVGLLVDAGGFPLEIHAFPGNKGETLTLLPVLDAFRARHAVEELVVVADAGMLSAANLNAVEDAGFKFIVGSRTSSAPHFQRHGNAFVDGQIIETVRTMGVGAKARKRRVVWHYSFKRDKRDNITLNKQIERAERVADGTRPTKKDRFVMVDGEERRRELDTDREGPHLAGPEGLRLQHPQGRARRSGRGRRLPRPVPGRGVVPDGEDRPARQTDVRLHRGLHPGTPHRRVLLPRHQPPPARDDRRHHPPHRARAPAPARRRDQHRRTPAHRRDPSRRGSRRDPRQTQASRGALK